MKNDTLKRNLRHETTRRSIELHFYKHYKVKQDSVLLLFLLYNFHSGTDFIFPSQWIRQIHLPTWLPFTLTRCFRGLSPIIVLNLVKV